VNSVELTAKGQKTLVVIQMASYASNAQPAHIHKGTCAKLDATPAYPLDNVVKGKSTTMVNVPLAFVGGVVAVLVGGGGRLSLGAIVGFVTIFGITIRNGIVLVAHFLHVEAEHGRALDRAALVEAAADRLAPILMTALATAIALVPLLLLGGRAGGEIEQPMALVIVGGLVTSTWLNLFVVPLWYASGRRR